MKLLFGFNKKEDPCKVPLDDADPDSEPSISTKLAERTKTDTFFLFVFAACVLVMLPFLIYTLCHSDINRISGYDKCGNVCGQKNIKYHDWECSGIDFTDKPVLSYTKNCEEAPEWSMIYGFEKVPSTQQIFWGTIWKLTRASLLPLGVCAVLIILYRYFPTIATALTFILIFAYIFVLIGFLQVNFLGYNALHVGMALIVAIVALVLLCTLIVQSRRIRLVTLLLQESIKALIDIKMTLCISITVFVASSIITCTFAATTMYMIWAGVLTRVGNGELRYIRNGAMVAALILNCIITWWVMQILLGAQYITVSGAVAKWYFTSFRTTYKYHLGTLSLGSLMITLMAIPRAFFKRLVRIVQLDEIFGRASRFMEGYFSEKTYIATAMQGTSFFHSGKKTVELLSVNVGNIVAANSVGSVVMFFWEVLVVSTCLLITCGLFEIIGNKEFLTFCIIYMGAISLICCYAILGPIKAAFNTMFLCICQDLLNDKDVNETYTMNVNKFLDTSYDQFAKKVRDKGSSLPSENKDEDITV